MRTKPRNIFIALASAIALTLGLAGCGGGSDDSSGGFVGLWSLVAMEYSDGTSDEEIDELAEMGFEITLELKEDGSAVFDFMGEKEVGTWEAKGDNSAVLTSDGDSGDLTLQGGQLVLSQDGDRMIFDAKAGGGSASAPKERPVTQDGDDTEATIDDGDFDDGEAVESGDVAEERVPVEGAVILIDNEFITLEVLGSKVDWADDPGYVLKITNNADVDVYVSAKYGSFSVDGRMLDPSLGETIRPGKYTEVFMYYWDDDLGSSSLDALVNVEGDIQVLEDESWDELGVFPVVFPDALDLPDLSDE